MHRLNRSLVLLALLLAAAAPARAQDHVYVSIQTNLDDAVVFADGVEVGPVAEGVMALPGDARTLRLLAPVRHGWTIAPVEVPLDAEPGDTVAVEAAFPYHYHVESVPYGASVHLETEDGWRRLGETPLRHTSDAPLEGRLVVELPAYLPKRLEPGREVWNAHTVVLDPDRMESPEAREIAWLPPTKTRRWIDYAAIGTALAAGALAVHYKFRADDLYRAYEETGDPALRPRIERYDLYSGVALGTMQVGVGVFAVRLALR